jgi:ABC-type enterochelin transport system substrate-binding protein
MNARDRLADETLRQFCLPLVGRVREEEPEEWGPWLESIPVERVRVMAVLLAALVPVDEPVSELTAWVAEERKAKVLDKDYIDTVAVERALKGETVKLTRAEAVMVTDLGTAQGMTAVELAKILGKDQRTIVRYRAEVRA